MMLSFHLSTFVCDDYDLLYCCDSIPLLCFAYVCMHYDLFTVVRPQSVMFESCVTLVFRNSVLTCADSVRDAYACVILV